MTTIFPDQPDIRPMPENNGNTYKLRETYIYETEKDYIYVPKNFEHDGASVPRLAWSLSGLSPDGLHRAAALVHDWLYVCKGRQQNKTYERYEADKIFYEIMIKSGCNKFRAKIAYFAVRAGGWKYWD